MARGCSSACAGRVHGHASGPGRSARGQSGSSSTSTRRCSAPTPTRSRRRDTYKGGFGFHPLCCFIDETEEAPAAILRPGNAGANTAADHIEVFDRALEQLPREVAERAQLVVRCDSAGATHDLLDRLHAAGVRFSVGFDLTEDVRQAVGVIADQDWVQAIGQDGAERDRAFAAELSLELAGWPPGTRAICRKERAHPGAQLSLIDGDGWRHQVFITDQDGEITELDRFHRARARCEDHVRAAKDTGIRNPPLPRLRRQRSLARAVADRPGPARLDEAALPRRRPRPRRAQAAALPAAPPGRAHRPLGQAHATAPAAQLAVGASARHRVRADQSAPRRRTLNDARRPKPPRPPRRPARESRPHPPLSVNVT